MMRKMLRVVLVIFIAGTLWSCYPEGPDYYDDYDIVYTNYDNNYVLRNKGGKLALAAKVLDPASGRVLEVLTTEPGVQLYTANWFDGSLTGKCGKPHLSHSAFCLETQHYPDSMNHPGFPNVILRPGEKYNSQTIWKFSTE